MKSESIDQLKIKQHLLEREIAMRKGNQLDAKIAETEIDLVLAKKAERESHLY